MPINFYWIPPLIEYLIALFLFLKLPFQTVYIWKFKNFWEGEFTLMLLIVVSISASYNASTLSYILFGRYMRVNSALIPYSKNPNNSFYYINSFPHGKGFQKTGVFLSCYSLFTFFSVGHGILVTFRHSALMVIPFFFLIISTFLSNKIISYILISQLIIHIIYLTLLQFPSSRKFLAEFGKLCNLNRLFKKTGKKSMTTLFICDIITFSLFVFPILCLVLDGSCKKIRWGYFDGGVIVLGIGIVFHIYATIFQEDGYLPIFSNIFITWSVYIFGFGLKGYVPFIKAYTFEVTSLSWSIMLDLIALKCGHSPFLYRIYRGFIIVASLILIEQFEYFGWMEVFFGFVQFIMDELIMGFILKEGAKYICWTMFASVGVAIFCTVPGFVICYILFLIFGTCC